MKKIFSVMLLSALILPIFAEGGRKEAKNIKESKEICVLTGTVVDQTTGEVLPGAQIKISGLATAVYTDLDGNFEVPSIKTGTYNLEIILVSYHDNKIKNLVVSSEKQSTLKVELKR